MRIRVTIELNGKSATGIRVPDEVVASLGAGKRPPVRVTIGGYTYRSSIGSMGGKFMVPVTAESRERAGVGAGDEEVDIELDTEPREVTVPPELKDALEGEPDAMRFLEGLSYSNQRRLLTPIEEAKTAETRQRRIAKVIDQLREGRI